MSTISVFQCLPPHAVKIIIDHIVGSIRMNRERIIPGTDKYRALLKPLMWVCSNFRALALSLYCHAYSLDFASALPSLYTDRLMSTDYPDIGHPTHHLATNLRFSFDEWDVYTGESLKKLSIEPYNGCVFPVARSLALLFASNLFDKYGRPSPFDIESNIRAFVQRIRQMVPVANTIYIKYYPLCGQLKGTPYFGILASQLFQLVRHVSYSNDFDSYVPMWLHIDIICNLVHMHFMVESYRCPSILLARLNAPTLQVLVLYSDYVVDLTRLIQNHDGSCVTYPCLHSLKLIDDADDFVPERVTFRGVVPFPRLRRIELHGCYPFGDDVLFRGNSSTLEYLELLISDLLVSIIIDYNVFTPSSHPKLGHVVTSYRIDEMPSQFATPVDTLRFMLSIGSGAPIRKVGGEHTSSDLAPAFLSSLNYSSIRVLTLWFFCPELLDTIALVRELPALSTLRTSPPSIGSIPNHVDRDKLPAYVVSTYAPVSRKFRYRHYQRYQLSYRPENVQCVLLLALAFPSYTYSDKVGGVETDFTGEMERAIASDMFKPYAPCLQSFLSNCVNGY